MIRSFVYGLLALCTFAVLMFSSAVARASPPTSDPSWVLMSPGVPVAAPDGMRMQAWGLTADSICGGPLDYWQEFAFAPGEPAELGEVWWSCYSGGVAQFDDRVKWYVRPVAQFGDSPTAGGGDGGTDGDGGTVTGTVTLTSGLTSEEHAELAWGVLVVFMCAWVTRIIARAILDSVPDHDASPD